MKFLFKNLKFYTIKRALGLLAFWIEIFEDKKVWNLTFQTQFFNTFKILRIKYNYQKKSWLI